ncbi:TetR/AcrR family transcriptional regulator [Rhodovibrionaceae bacterium A322]
MTKTSAAGNRRQQQKADSRDKVVSAAARLFRDRGVDGAGIAEIMKAAGLTHGGFYAHFQGKEDLLSSAITQAMTQKRGDWFSDLDDLPPEDQLKRVTRRYLSMKHRDLRDDGCALAALGTDLSRSGAAPQNAMACELRKAQDRITTLMTERQTRQDLPTDETSPAQQENQDRALALFALYVGGIVVSRAVGDSPVSDQVIEACRHLADREVDQVFAAKDKQER